MQKPIKIHTHHFFYPIYPFSYIVNCWNFWKDLITPRYYINFFRYKWQRATRGFADCDVWEIDGYINDLFHNMMIKFKEIHHGYDSNITEEEYEQVLEDIIDGQKAYHDYLNDVGNDHCYDRGDDKDALDSIETFEQWVEDLNNGKHKFDREAYKIWKDGLMARYKKGCKLYNKYHMSFWD